MFEPTQMSLESVVNTAVTQSLIHILTISLERDDLDEATRKIIRGHIYKMQSAECVVSHKQGVPTVFLI